MARKAARSPSLRCSPFGPGGSERTIVGHGRENLPPYAAPDAFKAGLYSWSAKGATGPDLPVASMATTMRCAFPHAPHVNCPSFGTVPPLPSVRSVAPSGHVESVGSVPHLNQATLSRASVKPSRGTLGIVIHCPAESFVSRLAR